jgi:hypothetical protein
MAKSRNFRRKRPYLPGEKHVTSKTEKPYVSHLDISFWDWCVQHQLELALVAFGIALIFGIFQYGKTKNALYDPGPQTSLIEKYQSEWKSEFPGGYKLIVVKRDVQNDEYPLYVNNLPGVHNPDSINPSAADFHVSFLKPDTLPKDLGIPWQNMLIGFSDPEQQKGEEGKVYVNKEAKVFIQFKTDEESPSGNMPVKFSFNRKVGETYDMMTAGNFHFNV